MAHRWVCLLVISSLSVTHCFRNQRVCSENWKHYRKYDGCSPGGVCRECTFNTPNSSPYFVQECRDKHPTDDSIYGYARRRWCSKETLPMPHCENSISNGKVTCSGPINERNRNWRTMYPDSVCVFTCSPGFELHGSPAVRCVDMPGEPLKHNTSLPTCRDPGANYLIEVINSTTTTARQVPTSGSVALSNKPGDVKDSHAMTEVELTNKTTNMTSYIEKSNVFLLQQEPDDGQVNDGSWQTLTIVLSVVVACIVCAVIVAVLVRKKWKKRAGSATSLCSGSTPDSSLKQSVYGDKDSSATQSLTINDDKNDVELYGSKREENADGAVEVDIQGDEPSSRPLQDDVDDQFRLDNISIHSFQGNAPMMDGYVDLSLASRHVTGNSKITL